MNAIYYAKSLLMCVQQTVLVQFNPLHTVTLSKFFLQKCLKQHFDSRQTSNLLTSFKIYNLVCNSHFTWNLR